MKKLIVANKKISVIFFLLFHFTSNCQDSLKRIDIAELLYNSTIRIETIKDSVINGKKVKISKLGTGFYFNSYNGKDTIPLIVTNKHVIENCNTGILKFNSQTNGKPNYGDILTITIPDFEKLWINHPSEDLAVLPLNPISERIFNLTKKLPFCPSFSEQEIPSISQEEDFSAIEEVLMVGYPKGLSDTTNNLPILRQGVTATPIFINYNKKRHFLLDIPIYPGSSGSPILIYSSGGYKEKNGAFVVGSTKFFFVGIAMESQNYEAKGKTISNDPKKILETSTSLPFEIAIIIKSSALLDFKSILDKAIRNTAFTNPFERAIQNSYMR